jgi:hypothetical protein
MRLVSAIPLPPDTPLALEQAVRLAREPALEQLFAANSCSDFTRGAREAWSSGGVMLASVLNVDLTRLHVLVRE